MHYLLYFKATEIQSSEIFTHIQIDEHQEVRQ